MSGNVHVAPTGLTSREATPARVLAGFLDHGGRGPRALVIEGEPGIGKTTLAEQVASRLRIEGSQVTWLHVGRPETPLSFAALGDLLETVPDAVVEDLADPLREALGVVALRVPDHGIRQDQRAVAAATLAVVRRLTAQRPLVLVVDDVQWLDPPSAQVLSFVLQRLDSEPLGLLATRRTDAPSPALDLEHALPSARVQRVRLGPMPLAEFVHLLRTRVSEDLPRSLIVHVHEIVEGNPFFGLELVREAVRRGVPGPGYPLPLPRDAFAVVRGRVEGLASETRDALTLAALLDRPTVPRLQGAVEGSDVERALVEAEREHLVEIRQGEVAFTHPIYASALTAAAPAPDLRLAHRRVAAVCDSPEERARHLALASLHPDADVADALDEAQDAARRRGATGAAAELAALSEAFTPEEDRSGRLRRAVTAGLLAFEAGDAVRGQERLRSLVATMEAGPERAQVMVTLCEICWQDTVEVERLALGALEEPGASATTIAGAHLMLAWTYIYRGEVHRSREHVDLAGARLRGQAEPAVHSDLHAVDALVSFLERRPYRETIATAVALEDPVGGPRPMEARTVYSGARVTRGLIGLWSCDLEEARDRLESELARLEAQGRYVARDEVLCYLAQVSCRTGAWAEAERIVQECLEIGEESGHLLGRGQNLQPLAWLAAVRGDVATARTAASEALDLSTRYRDELAVAGARAVLGLLALADEDARGAAQELLPVARFVQRSHGCWPFLTPCIADAVEALVGVGELEEAAALLDDERLCGTPGSDQAALCARGQAVLAAARGDLAGATAVVEEALASPALVQQPFERARTLLLAGEVARRRRWRSVARDRLLEAESIFDTLGAPRWSARAHAEADRVEGRAPTGALTSGEARVVALVADGLTNREVAERLFVSVKTVEATLSRVYRKHGLRSRPELVRWWLTAQDGHRSDV